MTKSYFVNPLNEDDLQWNATSKYLKWNISATAYWIILKFKSSAYMTKPCFVNPSNEDDLKILKVEYLSNRLLDHTQMLNLDLGDQYKVFKYFK